MLIYDLDFPALTNLLKEWNEPAYRAKQIWQGLYQHLYNSPEQFSNLPKSLREKLAEYVTFSPFKVKLYLDSADGFTRKTLFELPDQNLIEAVLMRYGDPADSPQIKAPAPNSENLRGAKNRRTLCISTQAGCAMGCVFCATGQMGFKRHLTSGEIIAQVMYYARMLKDVNESVTNIVLMGMGEPFHNYDNTMEAIDRLNDADGFNFGARRFVSEVAPSSYKLSIAGEFNYTISFGVGDEYLVIRIHRDKWFVIEPLAEPCVHIPLRKRHEGCSIFVWAKRLDTLVPCVGHIHNSIIRNRNADRLIKLAGIESRGAKLCDVIPVRIKNNDTFVSGVSNIHMTLSVHCNTAWAPEITVRFGHVWYRLTVLSPHLDRLTIR